LPSITTFAMCQIYLAMRRARLRINADGLFSIS
jgi:hypothetical protein